MSDRGKCPKPAISEVIVVEGRDDTCAVKAAVDCLTIETHGFGIKKETWELIERAYSRQGIIIFTDPDHAGEQIRRKLAARFPDAKHAFLERGDATRAGDVGIENAAPEAIAAALGKALSVVREGGGTDSQATNLQATNLQATNLQAYTEEDLFHAGLVGAQDSKARRQTLGKLLGIGYTNGRGLVARLNGFGIDRGDFHEAIRTIDDKTD